MSKKSEAADKAAAEAEQAKVLADTTVAAPEETPEPQKPDRVRPYLESLPPQNAKVIQALGALVQYAPVGSRSRVETQNLLEEIKVSGGILEGILTGEEGKGHVPAPRTDVPDPQIPKLSDEASGPIGHPWNPGMPTESVPVLSNAEGDNISVTPAQVAAGALDGPVPGADTGLATAEELQAHEDAVEDAKNGQ